MGLVLLLCGLAALFAVPATFTLSGRAWVVGVLIFLPTAIATLFEATRRLSKTTLVLSEEGVELRGRFGAQSMRWSDVTRIRAQMESDDEGRIILEILDRGGKRIRILQGVFSIRALDEIVATLKQRAAQHAEIQVEDSSGVWASWEQLVEHHRRLRPD
jgi:hypothetical protein